MSERPGPVDLADPHCCHRAIDLHVPAILAHSVLLLPGLERSADKQILLGPSQGDIEQPPVFLPLARIAGFRGHFQRTRQILLARAEYGQAQALVHGPIQISRCLEIRIARGVGQYDDRCLQPLGAVDRHDAHRPPRLSRIPLDFNRTAIKPVDEPLQGRSRLALERQRLVGQLLDRVSRLVAQTRQQLAPSLHRPGKDVLEKAVRRCEVRHTEQVQ